MKLLALLMIIPLLASPAFAQDLTVQEKTLADIEIEKRLTPEQPLPADSPFHFLEDVSEAIEFAFASPEDKILIKMKHAEKRKLEIEQAIRDGKPELLDNLGEKYEKEIESVSKESINQESQRDDDKVKEARIRAKVQEKLAEHERYFGQKHALDVLQQVQSRLAEKGVEPAGLATAIDRISENLKSKITEEQEQVRKANIERTKEIKTDIQREIAEDGTNQQEKERLQEKLKDVDDTQKKIEKKPITGIDGRIGISDPIIKTKEGKDVSAIISQRNSLSDKQVFVKGIYFEKEPVIRPAVCTERLGAFTLYVNNHNARFFLKDPETNQLLEIRVTDRQGMSSTTTQPRLAVNDEVTLNGKLVNYEFLARDCITQLRSSYLLVPASQVGIYYAHTLERLCFWCD